MTVGVGGTGQVSLYNGRRRSVDVIADVAGYYQDGTVSDSGRSSHWHRPAARHPQRHGCAAKAAVGAGQSLTLQVSGAGGVPASGAGAVVMNVTATIGHEDRVHHGLPGGRGAADRSNLNYTAGRTVPNLVTVGLGHGQWSRCTTARPAR